MKFPSLVQAKMMDEKGFFTEAGNNLMTELLTVLQNHLSDEGYKLPFQTTSNLVILNNDKSIGRILYDQDAKLMKVNLDGTYKTIQTA